MLQDHVTLCVAWERNIRHASTQAGVSFVMAGEGHCRKFGLCQRRCLVTADRSQIISLPQLLWATKDRRLCCLITKFVCVLEGLVIAVVCVLEGLVIVF
jgi:hypothetical protein